MCLNEIEDQLNVRIKNVPFIAISNETRKGYIELKQLIEKGKTYCMLGSSGVGKSTLLNMLSGRHLMKTDDLSESTNKGRHVTSHRELVVLDDGGFLIDNPGMRELGIAHTGSGLEITFDSILEVARNCRFKDCTHTTEMNCAVGKAIENGELTIAALENFRKMEKEKAHYQSSLAESRKKDKEFGKMMKNYKKDILKKN